MMTEARNLSGEGGAAEWESEAADQVAKFKEEVRVKAAKPIILKLTV